MLFFGREREVVDRLANESDRDSHEPGGIAGRNR